MHSIVISFLFLFVSAAVCAQGDLGDAVSMSELTQTGLPAGTYMVRDGYIPAEYQQLFQRFIDSMPNAQQGRKELFVINGDGSRKSGAAKLRAEFENGLRSAGWQYQVHGREGDIEIFTAVQRSPKRKNIFGYWTTVNNSLVLAMTEVLDGKAGPANGDVPAGTNPSQNAPSGSPQIITVSASEDFVNVMGKTAPNMPSFPALTKKGGTLRGYVKDAAGRPLQGAYIGIRSTVDGGRYSGASAVTDAKGYYEIQLPTGAIHLYAASYTVDYGDLRAAMSLHPADGRLDSFASANGDVENFVLLSYGIADRDRYSEKPNGSVNFYGGAVRINYNLAESGDSYAPENYIGENSEIEITLTPVGGLLDGTAGSSFVIRKNVGSGMFFNIYNIPVGKYTLEAKLARGGKPLFMRQSPRNKNTSGISPREVTGRASLTFEPDSAQNAMIKPAYGSWTPIDINLYLFEK